MADETTKAEGAQTTTLATPGTSGALGDEAIPRSRLNEEIAKRRELERTMAEVQSQLKAIEEEKKGAERKRLEEEQRWQELAALREKEAADLKAQLERAAVENRREKARSIALSMGAVSPRIGDLVDVSQCSDSVEDITAMVKHLAEHDPGLFRGTEGETRPQYGAIVEGRPVGGARSRAAAKYPPELLAKYGLTEEDLEHLDPTSPLAYDVQRLGKALAPAGKVIRSHGAREPERG